MLHNTTKHTALARSIVRKSGIRMGTGVPAVVERGLQWLIDIWYERRTYNQPNNLRELEVGDDGVGPFELAKMVPKKLSDEDFDITYMQDTVGSALSSIATYDIYECAPTFWGLGGEYPVGAKVSPPPALDPGGSLDRTSQSYELRPYVTGATTYDPFPYPEYPNYFWADLRHCQSIYIFYASGPAFEGRVVAGPTATSPGGEGFEDSDARIIAFDEEAGWTPQVWFGIKASLDGGETWEGPMADLETRVEEHYPYWEGNPAQPFYYRESGELNLLDSSPGGYYTFANSPSIPFYNLKNKFRVDNVLMKFVLWGALEEEKIYLTHWGVRGVTDMPSSDERCFNYKA